MAAEGLPGVFSAHQLVSALAGVAHLDVTRQSSLSSAMTGVELLLHCSDGDNKVRLKEEEAFVFAFRVLRS